MYLLRSELNIPPGQSAADLASTPSRILGRVSLIRGGAVTGQRMSGVLAAPLPTHMHPFDARIALVGS